jgi:hypothetical protein
MGITAVLASVAGVVGYVAASNGWVFLVGTLAQRVPADRHVPFLTDLWIHNASYASGFLGGVILMGWVWRQRLLRQPRR